MNKPEDKQPASKSAEAMAGALLVIIIASLFLTGLFLGAQYLDNLMDIHFAVERLERIEMRRQELGIEAPEH